MQRVVWRDGSSVSINYAFKHGTQQLTNQTPLTVSFGGTVFLGTLDAANKDTVELVFARVSSQIAG